MTAVLVSRLDTAAFERDNLGRQNSLQGLQMRNVLALTAAVALTAITFSSSEPAQAGDRWPGVPDEVGVRPLGGVGRVPYRCGERPVFNLYHGAYYDAPPAIHLGYAYRPYYRYTAYHVIPRTYFCVER
jgi:hypothetical protein